MQTSLILVSCLLLGESITSPSLTPGNIVICGNNTIKEYTRTGVLVQSILVPYPGDDTYPKARDLIASSTGVIEVFNGTFDPYLSTLDVSQNTWTHQTYAGWSLVNNGSYGGLATDGRYVYVADMSTSGTSNGLCGIVRFDRTGGATVRFADAIEPLDVNIGLDGLLYAMYPGGSPSGTEVDVYDPATLTKIRTVDIAAVAGRQDFRGVAADSDGSLYVVTWGGVVYHLDSTGDAILNSLTLSVSSTFDIDIAADGAMLIGSTSGKAILTDRELSSSQVLTVGSGNVFVAFVVPEPSTAILLVGLTLGLLAYWRGRLAMSNK